MGKTKITKQHKRMNKELRRGNIRSKNTPDQVDRIRDHIIEGAKLYKRDQRALQLAMLIYPKLCAGWTTRQIYKFLTKEIENPPGLYQCQAHIKKTKKIFAGAIDSTPDIEKAFLIEMAKQSYQVALKKKNGRDMTAATKLLAQLQGAFDKGGGMTEVYEQLTLPDVYYSDNPQVLQEPTIDAEYEELPDTAAIPAPQGDPVAQE